MLTVCIVEGQDHPAPGLLGASLPDLNEFSIETLSRVPDDLGNVDVVVLNSIMLAPQSIPVDQLLEFIRAGGGMFAIHDSVFPIHFMVAL